MTLSSSPRRIAPRKPVTGFKCPMSTQANAKVDETPMLTGKATTAMIARRRLMARMMISVRIAAMITERARSA